MVNCSTHKVSLTKQVQTYRGQVEVWKQQSTTSKITIPLLFFQVFLQLWEMTQLCKDPSEIANSIKLISRDQIHLKATKENSYNRLFPFIFKLLFCGSNNKVSIQTLFTRYLIRLVKTSSLGSLRSYLLSQLFSMTITTCC